MSPSSAGNGATNLEVERYIGSYLISATARSKNTPRVKNMYNYHHPPRDNNNMAYPQRVYGPSSGPNVRYHPSMSSANTGNGTEGWAGGMPLISMANHQRSRGVRKNNANMIPQQSPQQSNVLVNGMGEEFQQQSQLSRLAIHTHGVPLIFAGRYHCRKNGNYQPKYLGHGAPVLSSGNRCVNNNNHNQSVGGESTPKIILNNACENSKDSSTVSNIDTLSVASDESSGSTNSENCLPRIIKPRKRRKKDRKPTPVSVATTNTAPTEPVEANRTEGTSTDPKSSPPPPGNLVTLQAYIPSSMYYPTTYNRHNYADKGGAIEHRKPVVIVRNEHKFSVPISEMCDIPKLHHDFDDVKDLTQNQCSPISCQCKFCDPSGQIWDIDSPFLTTTESVFFNNSIYTSSTNQNECSGSNNSEYSIEHTDNDSGDSDESIVNKMASALRRSWSDPVATIAHREDNADLVSGGGNVGVIGAGRLCREWHGNPSVSSTSTATAQCADNVQLVATNANTQILDISTEIVTSHNGHRDLEIKFFSSPSTSVCEDKSYLSSPPPAYFEEKVLFTSSVVGSGHTTDSWHVDGSNTEEKDCDISYDTADISRLLLNIEE